MVALYLKAIKKEVEELKSLGLSNTQIAKRLNKRFEQGLSRSQGQTSTWRAVAEMILEDRPLKINDEESIVFKKE